MTTQTLCVDILGMKMNVCHSFVCMYGKNYTKEKEQLDLNVVILALAASVSERAPVLLNFVWLAALTRVRTLDLNKAFL